MVVEARVGDGQADLVAQDAVKVSRIRVESGRIRGRQIQETVYLFPVFQRNTDHGLETGIVADGFGKGGSGQPLIRLNVQDDERLGSPGEIWPDHFFQLSRAGAVQIVHVKAPGRHRGETLMIVVPEKKETSLNLKKLQNLLQGQIGNFLKVQGMSGNSGNLVEQEDFPAMLQGHGLHLMVNRCMGRRFGHGGLL
jgi:hypothetical protein